MRVTLDGQGVFGNDGVELQVESWKRDSIERRVGGLDGLISVDLGVRSRKLIQKGSLRAYGEAAMEELLVAISGFMDGRGHVLLAGNESYANVVIDEFVVTDKRFAGSGVVADYRIVYRQLAG